MPGLSHSAELTSPIAPGATGAFDLSYFIDHPKRDVGRYHRQGDIAGISGLPPYDAWQIDPWKDRFETPTDDRGLVDVDQLFVIVKSAVPADYQWRPELSLDHIYYDEALYKSSDAPPSAASFCELSVNKMIVLREFENVKHIIMLRPRMPSEEVMRLRVESWIVARSLFKSIRNLELLERRRQLREDQIERDNSILPPEFDGEDEIGQEYMRTAYERHSRGFEINLGRLEGLPQEFRLVEPEGERRELGERLCRVVGAEALHMVHKVMGPVAKAA